MKKINGNNQIKTNNYIPRVIYDKLKNDKERIKHDSSINFTINKILAKHYKVTFPIPNEPEGGD